MTELSKAFALAVPHDEAIRIRDDVGFFQAVRTAIAKRAVGERKASGDLDHAIRQIVSKAVASTIDWTVKESVRAIVKRILRKYGYPPDKQDAATQTVLQQAELLSDFWTGPAMA